MGRSDGATSNRYLLVQTVITLQLLYLRITTLKHVPGCRLHKTCTVYKECGLVPMMSKGLCGSEDGLGTTVCMYVCTCTHIRICTCIVQATPPRPNQLTPACLGGGGGEGGGRGMDRLALVEQHMHPVTGDVAADTAWHTTLQEPAHSMCTRT